MAFCKVCVCGEKIIFERRLSFPDNCPSCGRKLVDYLTYAEDDPHVEELLHIFADSNGNNTSSFIPHEKKMTCRKYYTIITEGWCLWLTVLLMTAGKLFS